MRDARGAVSVKIGVDSASMRDGYLKPSVQNAASIEWQAMSPSAPVPKSPKPPQRNAPSAGGNGPPAAGPPRGGGGARGLGTPRGSAASPLSRGPVCPSASPVADAAPTRP